MEKFRNRIHKLRTVEYDMSQKEFAKKLDISQNYVSDLEKGKRIPSLQLVMRVSKTFNVPLSQLLDKQG
jgi:transcriptional regulator with XRE-family HTH domain